MLIHDFADQSLISSLGSRWRAVSDQVMGGVSQPALALDHVAGQPCLRLTGAVSLENNGGFIQASLDLSPGGGILDASAYRGFRLHVYGQDERYGVHLRSSDTERPWQSYRAGFIARPAWQTIDLDFTDFAPHRLDKSLNIKFLRRLGLAAIGREFEADLAVARIEFVA